MIALDIANRFRDNSRGRVETRIPQGLVYTVKRCLMTRIVRHMESYESSTVNENVRRFDSDRRGHFNQRILKKRRSCRCAYGCSNLCSSIGGNCTLSTAFKNCGMICVPAYIPLTCV